MEPEHEEQHTDSNKQPKVIITKSHLADLLGTSEMTIRPLRDDSRIVLEAQLSPRQVRDVFVYTGDKYPEILTYLQAAELVQVSESTLKGWFSQGRYANCVKRGKPGRVLRDTFLQEFMKDNFG